MVLAFDSVSSDCLLQFFSVYLLIAVHCRIGLCCFQFDMCYVTVWSEVQTCIWPS